MCRSHPIGIEHFTRAETGRAKGRQTRVE